MTAQTEPEAGIAQLPPDDRPLCGVRAFAGGPLPRGPGPKEPEVRRCLKGDRCRDAASEIGVLPRPSSSNPSKSCNMHDMGCVRPMWVQVSTCGIPTIPRTRMHGNESCAAVAHAACLLSMLSHLLLQLDALVHVFQQILSLSCNMQVRYAACCLAAIMPWQLQCL